MRTFAVSLCVGAWLGCYRDVDLTLPPRDAVAPGSNPDATVVDAPEGGSCPDRTSPTPLVWTAALAIAEDGCIAQRPVGAGCVVRLDVPVGETLATWCTTERGRAPTLHEPGRCEVQQIGPTGAVRTDPPPTTPGYYLLAGTGGSCPYRVVVTHDPGGRLRNARLHCVIESADPSPPVHCTAAGFGAPCELQRPGACVFDGGACAAEATTVLRAGTPQCMEGLCVSRRGGTSTASFCSCFCQGRPNGPDCTCPAGSACTGSLEIRFNAATRSARYCVPTP